MLKSLKKCQIQKSYLIGDNENKYARLNCLYFSLVSQREIRSVFPLHGRKMKERITRSS